MAPGPVTRSPRHGERLRDRRTTIAQATRTIGAHRRSLDGDAFDADAVGGELGSCSVA
jgi:hypothetical protein